MFLMGTDVSGHVGAFRHAQHMSFVLGAEEDINRVHNRLGVSYIHMTKLSHTKRNKIISKLLFDRGTMALCAYVEKQLIINQITNDPRFDRHRSTAVVHRHFNYILWNCMRETIEQFTADHRCDVRDIVVQCDRDMEDAALQWHMKKSHKGKAHDLADIVGWCNSHHRRIRTCQELDFRAVLLESLRRDLLK